jgi:predicted enzyme related to lactoylglutathione lyase
MRIEHIALQVEDPAAMAAWYAGQFGWSVRRAGDGACPVRFIADSGGQVMLELYRNPAVPVPDYRAMDPLTLHLALVSEDVPADRDRLIQSGCEPVGEIASPGDDQLAMLRDPWGLAIQLARRAEPMV